MKPTDKISRTMLVDLLEEVGLESDGEYGYYCHESEKQVHVKLNGNTLAHVLKFIKSYYKIPKYDIFQIKKH